MRVIRGGRLEEALACERATINRNYQSAESSGKCKFHVALTALTSVNAVTTTTITIVVMVATFITIIAQSVKCQHHNYPQQSQQPPIQLPLPPPEPLPVHEFKALQAEQHYTAAAAAGGGTAGPGGLDGGGGRVRGEKVLVVPGNGQLQRQASRVDRVIFPYESFATNQTDYKQTSYIIDHKRFVEPYSSRCMATTLLEDPDSVEPEFVVIRPGSEVRVRATASAEAIRAAGYDPRQRTTIFVHGFTQSYPETDWLRKVRALHEMHHLVGKHNFIIMDWGLGSHGSYSQVAARASGMGSFLANFLMKLIDDLGTDRANLHIIGHSLGAHVAGFAGKRIRPRIGRITGLDAAGPCFGKFFSNSANDRLAPDDAHEVDVFHYDDGFLGLGGQVGQFDVYVNGGASQPGATDNVNSMMQALVTMVFRRNRALSESHTRSTEVSTSRLSLTGCQLVAYECRDWPAFLAGECGRCDDSNQQCFGMDFYYQYENREPAGLRQSHPGKQLFIVTSPRELYCLQHFQLLVRFELAPDLVNLARKQKWRLHLELINEQNERSNLVMTNQLEPNVFSHLLLSEMAPLRFVKARLQVRQGDDKTPVVLYAKHKQQAPARPYSQPPRVNLIEVNFMSHIEPVQRRRMSSRLCPTGWLEEQNSIEDSSSKATSTDTSEWLALDVCS